MPKNKPNTVSINNVNKYDYKRKNRRPIRNKTKPVTNALKILSCNSFGLRSKLFSFSQVLNNIDLSMFCLQETHLLKEGSVKFKREKDFQMFEKLCETKSGGGLVIGALKELNPIWIGDVEKEVEALSIKISVSNRDIRVVNAYGPQEYDDILKKINFWKHLDNEVFEADKAGN